MNIDRLRAVQAEERDADSLRPLPDAFYREVADYLETLRERRSDAAEAAADPFGAEDVRRLTDEIETAEEVAEAIYERRVGKLVKRASLAAAGMPADEEGLTAEEAELFSDLVDQIEDHREAVLASFAATGTREAVDREAAPRGDDAAAPDGSGGGGGPASDPPDASAGESTPDQPADTATGSADVDREGVDPTPDDVGRDDDGDGGSPAATGPSSDGDDGTADPERVTVRITRDVGEVFGVDERVYDLASEDVVSLPAANARPLFERDAAEPID